MLERNRRVATGFGPKASPPLMQLNRSRLPSPVTPSGNGVGAPTARPTTSTKPALSTAEPWPSPSQRPRGTCRNWPSRLMQPQRLQAFGVGASLGATRRSPGVHSPQHGKAMRRIAASRPPQPAPTPNRWPGAVALSGFTPTRCDWPSNPGTLLLHPNQVRLVVMCRAGDE